MSRGDRPDLSDPAVREAIAREATQGAQRLLLWLAVAAAVVTIVGIPVGLAIALR